jgi:glutamine amidotransferase
VSKALQRVAPQSQVLVTADPDAIRTADRVVVPGQGALPDCMRQLGASGAREAVLETVRTKPFLGICIGMQMLFERGEEGDVAGLGVLAGNVPRFPARMEGLKVRTWAGTKSCSSVSMACGGASPAGRASISCTATFPRRTIRRSPAASCTYGVVFTCAVARDNIFAVQFHPEKSQSAGLQLLSNFIDWRP